MLLDKLLSELSGGERQLRRPLQRRSYASRSVFYSMNHCLHLMPHVRSSLRAELVNLQKRLGTTDVFVTH